MDPVRIEQIQSADVWDRYVMGHEKSGYCHLFNWSRVIEEAYHIKSLYMAAVKKNSTPSGEICGILPLYRFKRGAARPRLVSVPFFDAGGILAGDRATEALLFGRSAAMVAAGRISAVELRQSQALGISAMKIAGTRSQIYTGKVGLHIDLPGSQQKLMAGFKSKLRSQIRKGGKNRLTWKIGKKELLDPFYQVFSRNMRDLGSPVHSKAFFNAVLTHFYHHAFICVVFYRSTPAAASFMFRFKKRLANPWASSIREFRHLNANMFLYWQMMRFACNMGMSVFDMGRSSRGASTYRFKKQWEPEETPLHWYRWTCQGQNPVSETLSMEPWKRLPVAVANLAGPLIRRHISL